MYVNSSKVKLNGAAVKVNEQFYLTFSCKNTLTEKRYKLDCGQETVAILVYVTAFYTPCSQTETRAGKSRQSTSVLWKQVTRITYKHG